MQLHTVTVGEYEKVISLHAAVGHLKVKALPLHFATKQALNCIRHSMLSV